MRVMILRKATRESEAAAPDPAFARQMLDFNEQLVRAGVLLAGEVLHPSSKGKRLCCDGAAQTVTEEPFPEGQELVASFWLWQVKSIDEAVEWVKRCPVPSAHRRMEIEIRPVNEDSLRTDQGPGTDQEPRTKH